MSSVVPGDKKISAELSSFLELSREKGCEENLIELIRNIGVEQYTVSAASFLKLDESQKEKLGSLLAETISLGKLKYDQVILFFRYIKSPFSKSFDFSKTTFKTLMPAYFVQLNKQLLGEELKLTYEDITVILSLSSRYLGGLEDVSFISKCYESMDKQAEEEFLKVFLKGLFDTKDSRDYYHGALIYAFKCVNPEIFQKVFDSITPDIQYYINKILYAFPTNIESYIKTKKFEQAVQEFIQHPNALQELSECLEKGVFEPAQIRELFSFIINLNNFPTLKYFPLIRIFFENENILKKHLVYFKAMLCEYIIQGLTYNNGKETCRTLFLKPSWYKYIVEAYNGGLSTEQQTALLSSLLEIEEDQSNPSLIKALQSSNPKLFDEVFSKKNLSPEKIKYFLDFSTEDHKTIYEQTIIEEMEISRFKEFLSISDNFSSAMHWIDSTVSKIEKTQNKHSDLPNILISLYFKKAIELNKIDKINTHLFSRLIYGPFVLKAYSKLEKGQQEKLISILLEQYGSRFNAVLIEGLREANASVFGEGLKNIQDKNLTEKIGKLLMVPGSAKSSISAVMEQFTMPFRRITGHGGKLVCAEIAKRKRGRKTYHFNPTILHHKDFRKYLYFLADVVEKTNQPVKERFVLTGDHWLAGEVRISPGWRKGEKPKIELLIIDSVGGNEPKTLDIIGRECSNLGFRTTLYLSGEKRQNSGAGCTVFALRDVQELFTIEKYLGGDLFEYLEKNKLPDSSFTSSLYFVNRSKLPLRFMRLEQSTNLLDATIPSREKSERSAAVNKKGENINKSMEKHFIKGEDSKARNERLSYLAHKIVENTFSYLCENDFDLIKIESEMFPISFEGRKALYAQKQSSIQAEEKDRKEGQEIDMQEDNPLILTGFDTLKNSSGKLSEDDSKEVKEKVEQDIYFLRNILQDIFKYQVADLGELIKYLCERHVKGSIKTVSQLKSQMKLYLESSNTYEELSGTPSYEDRCIDNINNQPYLQQILEKLPSVTMTEVTKKFSVGKR